MAVGASDAISMRVYSLLLVTRAPIGSQEHPTSNKGRCLESVFTFRTHELTTISLPALSIVGFQALGMGEFIFPRALRSGLHLYQFLKSPKSEPNARPGFLGIKCP